MWSYVLSTLVAGQLSGYSAHAAVKFSAEVDRTEVGMDESLTLRMKLVADESLTLPEPTASAPDFDEVNSYPQTFLRNLWVNGKISVETQMTLTKVLRPRKPGTFQIRDIRAVVGTQNFMAPPITVTVVGAGRGTPPQSAVRESDSGKKAFMVRAEVNKSRVFHGEQVIISYYLYRKSQLIRPEIRKFPDLADFNKQELEVPVQSSTALDWETVTVAGQAWARALLFRYAAYPLKKGEARVDSAQVEVQVPVRSQLDSLLEDSFLQMIPLPGLSTRSVRSVSDPLRVQVLPLPEGQPSGFSGIVGSVDAIAVADKTDLKTNEALTVTLKLEGRANFANLEKPALNVPDGIEAFEVRDRSKPGPGGINEKIFEYVLVPRKAGKFKIPGLSIPYFDPDKRQYRTALTEPIEVSVAQGQVAEESKTALSAVDRPAENRSIEVRTLLLGGLVALVGLVVLTGIVARRRKKPAAPARTRPGGVVPQKGLGAKAWSEALRRGDLAGMEGAVHLEAGALLGVEAAVVRGLPRRDLQSLWAAKNLPNSGWQALSNLLDSLEMARFSGTQSPGGPDSPSMQELTRHARDFFSSAL